MTFWCPLNIGNLQDRPLKSIVSPPYAEAQTGGGIAKEGYRGPHINEMGKNQPDKVGERCGYTQDAQGQTEGQITNLPDRPLKAIVSPPYEESTLTKDKAFIHKYEQGYRHDSRWQGGSEGEYGSTPGQIGNLKAVVSPPYEDSTNKTGGSQGRGKYSGTDLSQGLNRLKDDYTITNSEGQIGNETNEDYLSAMLKVYQEAAKVCDVLVVVTKNPTRSGKLRRLDLDTIAILKQSGWDIHCQHRSLLFEEVETTDMFGEYKKKPKGRTSFFKLLSYKKGAEVAMWEDVMFCRNRTAEG